jgi:hypothetical protein
MLKPSSSVYQMKVTYETIHGYQNTLNYPVKVNDYGEHSTQISYTSTVNEEEGSITLEMHTPKNSSTGELINEGEGYTDSYVIIRRSSHRSNFSH